MLFGCLPVNAAVLPVFTSKCVGPPVNFPLPAHPIVLFGDSITEGYGATGRCLPLYVRSILPESAHLLHTGDTTYPADLARLIHTSVLNYGVAKENTSDGVPRLKLLLRTIHPKTVVILEGTNDLWGNRSQADITGNLSLMARSVQDAGARPIILTVLPIDRPVFADAASKARSLDIAIRSMARQQGLTLVDTAAQFSAHKPISQLFRHADGREDGVHPNDAGYRVLAETVSAAIR